MFLIGSGGEASGSDGVAGDSNRGGYCGGGVVDSDCGVGGHGNEVVRNNGW